MTHSHTIPISNLTWNPHLIGFLQGYMEFLIQTQHQMVNGRMTAHTVRQWTVVLASTQVSLQ